MIMVMDDCRDLHWDMVRNSNKAVLDSIERGTLSPYNIFPGWERIYHSTLDKILRPRLLSCSVTASTTVGQPSQSSRQTKTRKQIKRVCTKWNSGSCSEHGDHVNGAFLWVHCCAYCWKSEKLTSRHKDSDCGKKKSKN